MQFSPIKKKAVQTSVVIDPKQQTVASLLVAIAEHTNVDGYVNNVTISEVETNKSGDYTYADPPKLNIIGVVRDSTNGSKINITIWNKGAETVLGCTAPEFIAMVADGTIQAHMDGIDLTRKFNIRVIGKVQDDGIYEVVATFITVTK